MTIENSRQAAARLAHEARRRKAAQQTVSEAADEMRQQAAAVSPQAAGSLGAAIDSTAGFSLDPSARPNELPQPGSAPGGEAEKRTGNMFAGLVPEADGLNTGMMDEPEPAPPPPPSPPPKRVKSGPQRRQHPVLSQLREDLGVDAIRPVDVHVGGHVWTLVGLAPGDVATASRLADHIAVGQVEKHMTYQTAVVAHAIAAIDSVPTYRVFGVELPPGLQIQNPLRPPRTVRFHAAGNLFDFIQEEGRTTLSTKLFDAYMDKMDASGEVRSYLDEPGHKRVTYRCGHEGCDHSVSIVPRYVTGTRDMVLPYCQWHAEPMEPDDVVEDPDPLA